MDSDDEDDDNDKDLVFNSTFGGTGAYAVNRGNDPDAEFEGELGYNLIKSLRGRTSGRKLKRTIFKFGIIQLICGTSLTVITILAWVNFTNTEYYDAAKYGSTLLNLYSVVSFPTFIFGFVSMSAVRNWASLTTNRSLLSSLFKCYMVAFSLIFIFALWMAVATFKTFIPIKDWNESIELARIYPYYICTILFLMPLLSSILFYTLDISWHVEQIDNGGIIVEPDPPPYTMDMSDVTLFQSFVFVFALPCILCIQCNDLIRAFHKAYETYYKDQPLFPKKDDLSKEEKKKGRKILRRIMKTFMRWFRGTKRSEVVPIISEPPTLSQEDTSNTNNTLELANLQNGREEEERYARERANLDYEEKMRLQSLLEAEIEAERKRKDEEAMILAMQAINERKIRDENEKIIKQQQQEQNDDKNNWDRILTVQKYKSLWSSLSIAGSFQCNLKTLPSITNLTEHLKNKGFHIVFAAKPTLTDIEIGLCNNRQSDTDYWFMARFLITNNSFSAVMKAQNTEQVTEYVKKFALAKVLKIEK